MTDDDVRKIIREELASIMAPGADILENKANAVINEIQQHTVEQLDNGKNAEMALITAQGVVLVKAVSRMECLLQGVIND